MREEKISLTKKEIWELANAADQAASEPCEHLASAKEKLWAAYEKLNRKH